MAINTEESNPDAPEAAASEVPPARPLDGWNPDLNQDEAILAQEKSISATVCDNVDLVGPMLNLDVLSNEYAEDDNVYRLKIEDLKRSYASMRKTRPDGNCFFRAFGFAYFETLLNDEMELNRFCAIIEERKNDLIAQGMPAFTVDDFYDTFATVLEQVSSKEVNTTDKLLAKYNDEGLSNYLVVFLRLIVSGYLQKNEAFFENFIEGHLTVKDFCAHEVEPMYRESDHIHIIGITSAADVAVRITYLDRSGTGEKVSIHTFPENAEPRIHLLYRPGHYDILYPKAVGDVTPSQPLSPLSPVAAKDESAELDTTGNGSQAS
jgi:ubiquitin thioesterase protein OTUB1